VVERKIAKEKRYSHTYSIQKNATTLGVSTLAYQNVKEQIT